MTTSKFIEWLISQKRTISWNKEKRKRKEKSGIPAVKNLYGSEWDLDLHTAPGEPLDYGHLLKLIASENKIK